MWGDGHSPPATLAQVDELGPARTLIAKCICIDPGTGSLGPWGGDAEEPWGLSGESRARGWAQQSTEVDVEEFAVGFLEPLLQLWNQQLREVRLLAQGHTAWGGWGRPRAVLMRGACLFPQH